MFPTGCRGMFDIGSPGAGVTRRNHSFAQDSSRLTSERVETLLVCPAGRFDSGLTT
jgi:hypothetical protein